MIHVTDSQTDKILDFIPEDEFWDDVHKKSLKDTLETFDFVTFADREYAEHLAKRNRIIIPDEDGKYVEFIIENTRKFHGVNGFSVEVYTSASYIELIKAKVISPQTTPAWTPRQHADFALAGTGWEAGEIHFAGVRTLTIEKHTNPFSYLKRISSEFDLELHFRVEVDGNKVVRRYVDLLERVGTWRGREAEFGKDLIGIERKEDFSNIATALIGLGPIREDGTRLEVFVEDKDALARWGRNGQHLVEVYDPQSTDQDMTIERLTELTGNELEKRVNSVVEYHADIADLEKVPGLEHEKIRFGDTIKIKDTWFEPALYLEARVHTMERSIKKNGYKTVTLGDYIEYTEEDVLAIWKSLQAEIAKKVSMSDVTEVVYTKPEVDSKDAGVYQDSTQYSDIVSETKKQEAIQVAAVDATNKANLAEQAARAYADSLKQQTDQQIHDVEQSLSDLDTYVDGTFKDSVIQEAEAKAIEKYLNQLNAEKADIDAKYNDVYNNPSLSGTAKTNLSSKKSAYNTAHTNLINAINTAISDGKTTPAEKTDVDTKFSSYRTALSQLSTAFEDAIDAIAQTKAQQAENNAKTHADSVAEQKKQEAINAAIADAETKINAARSELEADIALKADAQWVNGQLVLKENAITKSNTAPANPTTGQLWLDTSVTPNVLKRWSGSAWVKATPTSAGEVGAYTKTEVDNALNSKVSVTQYNTDMNGVITRLDSAESRITQTENEIATKVSQTQYNQDKTALQNDISELETRMTNAETSITQNANQIALKANKTDVYTKTEVNNQLANKADNTTVNALETRISEAEAQLTIQANEIATKVSQTTFSQELAKKENSVVKSSTAPSNPTTNMLWLDTSVTPNVLKRWSGSAWVKATPTTAGEVGAYTKSETDTKLGTKANQSDLNTLTTRVSTAETNITQLSNQISLKANATDVYTKTEIDGQFNTVNQQISQLDAELSIQADQIATKVSQTELQTAIDGIQVGGRNLARQTDFSVLPSSTYWQFRGNYVGEIDTSNTYQGHNSLKITTNGAGANGTNDFVVWLRGILPAVSDNYTISFYAKAQTGGGKVFARWGGNGGSNQVTTSQSLTTNWQKFVINLTISSVTTGDGAVVMHFTTDDIINIALFKIEEGNKPTDWTPAPEDVQGQIDGLGTRVSTAETSITQLSDQISLKANKSEVDTLAGRMTSAESSINILTNQIELKANQTTVDELETRVSSAEINIDALNSEISLKANKSEVDTLTNRISQAESSITLLSDEIDLKVNKDGVISAINLSPETAKLQASKIELDGYVEAKHIKSLNGLNINDQFIVDSNGNVKFSGNLEGASGSFSGTITGSTIESSQFISEHQIDVDEYEKMILDTGSVKFERGYDLGGAYPNYKITTRYDALGIVYDYENPGKGYRRFYLHDMGLFFSGAGAGLNGDFHIEQLPDDIIDIWSNCGIKIHSPISGVALHDVKEITSIYDNTKNIIFDHENGNVSVSAVGSDLYLGYTNTNFIRSQKEHRFYEGARVINGNLTLDTGLVNAHGFKFTNFATPPASVEGILWYGDGYNGRGLYIRNDVGWVYIGG